ncbi:MAG TPA: RloB family protein [Kofleriaceae bacterium]|nr:RloB family protein [Kofleriaceae bacterium]
MEQRFRNRQSALRRRSAYREPKHRILIVCEGKKTEPSYFKSFQHHVRNRLVHVEIKGEAGVPKTVVQIAIEMRDAADRDAKAQKDENLRFDQVWCVFDVDEHPNLDEACACAEAASIQLAISSPCFELWALLHFQDQAEQIHRHDAQRALKAYLSNYEKALEFSRLSAGYDTAVTRATTLQEIASALSKPYRNPSTGVFLLTESIRRTGQS